MKFISKKQVVALLLFHFSLGFMIFFSGLKWFQLWDVTSTVLTLGTAFSFMYIRKNFVTGLYIGASIGVLTSLILIFSNLEAPDKLGPAISVIITGPLNALYYHVVHTIFTIEASTKE